MSILSALILQYIHALLQCSFTTLGQFVRIDKALFYVVSKLPLLERYKFPIQEASFDICGIMHNSRIQSVIE
jgi:hypothetical protein